MLHYILQVIFSILPDTRSYSFKRFVLRLRGYTIGSNVRIVSSVKLKIKKLSIGENTFIGFDTLIASGSGKVTIGKNVDIAPRCNIIGGTHEMGGMIHRAGKGISLDIVIGDGTWIGTNVTIIGGVCIGRGCVVAAGSVVRNDIPDNVLIAGVPAEIIRYLPV